jgi:hypothetical protein
MDVQVVERIHAERPPRKMASRVAEPAQDDEAAPDPVRSRHCALRRGRAAILPRIHAMVARLVAHRDAEDGAISSR